MTALEGEEMEKWELVSDETLEEDGNFLFDGLSGDYVYRIFLSGTIDSSNQVAGVVNGHASSAYWLFNMAYAAAGARYAEFFVGRSMTTGIITCIEYTGSPGPYFRISTAGSFNEEIQSIKVFVNNGNFLAGTRCTVYKCKNTLGLLP